MLLSINQKDGSIKMKIRIEFNWHNKWIGTYDEIRCIDKCFTELKNYFHHYWICIIPCFPIHIWWEIKNVRCSKIGGGLLQECCKY